MPDTFLASCSSFAGDVAPNLSHTSQKYLANCCSEIGRPSICMRSLTKRKCGEVYSPTLVGSRSACTLFGVGRYCARIDEMKEEVEPLPLVPAMCIRFNWSKSEGWYVTVSYIRFTAHHHIDQHTSYPILRTQLLISGSARWFHPGPCFLIASTAEKLL